MSTLILLRHGQSRWNQANRFTGWVNIPLSSTGIQEALDAAQVLNPLRIDCVFTSTLVRAQQTALLALANHPSGKIPIILSEDASIVEKSQIYSDAAQMNLLPVTVDWHLNERHYGALQGVNKDEARAKYGAEQVHIWRRSFDVPPPHGESLAMTAQRTLPYFEEQILPQLNQGKNCLIAAHGNSLRSIVMQIEALSPEQILQYEIPTGQPLLYNYQHGQFQPQSD